MIVASNDKEQCTHCGLLIDVQIFVGYDVKDLGLIIRVDPRRRGQVGLITRVDLHGGRDLGRHGRREVGPINLLQEIEQSTAGTLDSFSATVDVRPSLEHVPGVW